MTTEQIYAKLTSIFREVFDNDDIVLTAQTTAADIDDWDSVNHIRLMISIEAEFRIKFTVDEIAEAADVGEFVSLIRGKLS